MKEDVMTTSEKKRSKTLMTLLAIIGLIALLLMVWFSILVINRNRQANRAFNSRPLVLIHAPLNHDSVETGSAIFVHASARQRFGLRRLELWADDTLVAVREVPDEEAMTSWMLTESWVPTQPGSHTIIVRAIASDGTQGQAAVIVEAQQSAEVLYETYQVSEDDTLEAIAEAFDTTPEVIADLNPGLEGGEPSVGDELIVPGSEDPTSLSEEDLPVDESGVVDLSDEVADPPPTEADPPASFRFGDLLFELWHLIPFPSEPEEPIGVKLEVEALRSWGDEERLHCYIALGEGTPHWVPDVDGDPSTDESFTPLDRGWWDVQPYLAGDAAPVIYWPENQALSFTATCVGIAAGGTDALDLGTISLSIPPEDWDGSAQHVEVNGPEGQLYMLYRVSRLSYHPSGIPLYLDPDMLPPINVRLDERRNSLRWDYFPRPEDEPITGFRIYLNGNLQWVEDADTFESMLPYEWFHPPCGATYTFAVSAYRFELPDGPESLPGVVSITTPSEGCMREIQINLISLETFDLGGDRSRDNRSGDVGPPYGYFYANDWQIEFDARATGRRGGSLDAPLGLTHHTVYDLGTISADSSWRFSGVPFTVVEVPIGGRFEFGFHIMDHDDGRCRDSDDSGCDDLICEASTYRSEDSPGSDLDQFHRGSMTSDNGRCKLTYTFGPAFGSPVGSGVPGFEPLPWLSVQDVIIDPTTGEMQIPIINSGTATWPWRDLEVELQTRAGDSLGIYTWPDFVLEAGQQTILEHPEIRLDPPYDACVVIDPNDLVIEEYEVNHILAHNPICPELPDLIIHDVIYQAEGAGRLRVSVQNIGNKKLENREVKLEGLLPDGSPAYLLGSWPNVSLEVNQIRTFDLIGVNENARSRLQNGYILYVDPDNTIPESDDDNNFFEIKSGNLKIWWCDSFIPHYHGLGSTSRMHLMAEILQGDHSVTVMDARRSNTLTSMETFAYGYNHTYLAGNSPSYFGCDENSPVFRILGDEVLRVTISAEFRAGSYGDYENLGRASETFDDLHNWGAFLVDASNDWHSSLARRFQVVPPIGMLAPAPWWSDFCILQTQ
jgi:LysM repeat protein